MLCDYNLPVCTKTLHQVTGIDFRRYVISKCSVIVLSYLSHTVFFFFYKYVFLFNRMPSKQSLALG